GTPDDIGQVLAGLDVTYMQRRLLAAVGGDAIRQQPAVVAGKPPVESDRAVPGELIDVEQHALGPGAAAAHVQDRLVLASLAPRVEVEAAHGLGRAETADLEELIEALVDLTAARHLGEQ